VIVGTAPNFHRAPFQVQTAQAFAGFRHLPILLEVATQSANDAEKRVFVKFRFMAEA
jgi:hypothetical protein